MTGKNSRTSRQIVGGIMTKQQPQEVSKLPTFGQRKVASRASSVAAVRQLGMQRGIEMLPPLVTPFDNTSLHKSVAPLARKEARLEPVIDAAEALDAGWLELWYQPKFNAPDAKSPCI